MAVARFASRAFAGHPPAESRSGAPCSTLDLGVLVQETMPNKRNARHGPSVSVVCNTLPMPRCVIVTGSSSGTGRAVAHRLAIDGFIVLLADVRRDPLTGGEPTDELIR